MAIKEELQPAYRVVCDECGRLGPLRHSEEYAREAAKEEGWHIVVEGPLWLDVDYCPDCYAKWQREQVGGG